MPIADPYGSAIFRIIALAALLALAACEEPPRADDGIPAGSGFDFYVLALSWSPSYCEAEGDRANPHQCTSERRYGFIVHGLWPQFERGYPEYCSENPDPVDSDVERGLLDIVPSRALVRHQWKKHGTCSGLSQADFFRILRSARETVVIPDGLRNSGTLRNVSPDAVSAAFIDANPGLEKGDIAVTCDRRRLREVRICMTKQLGYRACPEVTKRGCRRPSVALPPVRG